MDVNPSPSPEMKNPLTLPNKMGRILFLSFEEVLGKTGINAILRLSELTQWVSKYPPNNLDPGVRFEQIGAFHQAMDQMYGPTGGRGLILRAGRACFKYGLHEFGPLLEVTELGFRLLPMSMKLKKGAEAYAKLLNQYTGQQVVVEERSDRFLWHVENCPLCWNRKTDSPCCHLNVGLLQEALYWVSGGKHYLVEEVHCIAAGDPQCSTAIHRQPLD